LTLAFSTTAIASLQSLLVDSFDPPALSLPQDPPRRPQELDIDQILIAPIGETVPWPYLLVPMSALLLLLLMLMVVTTSGLPPMRTTGHLSSAAS